MQGNRRQKTLEPSAGRRRSGSHIVPRVPQQLLDQRVRRKSALLAAATIQMGLVALALLNADTAIWITVVGSGAALVLTLSALNRLLRGDWFHPLGFPLLYAAFVLFVPPWFVAARGRAIFVLDPGDISLPLFLASLAFVSSLVFGTMLGLRAISFRVSRHPRSPNPALLGKAGLALLTVTLSLECWLLLLAWGAPRIQISGYGIEEIVETVATAVAVPGLAVLGVANARRRGRVLYGASIWVFWGTIAAYLARGERNQPLALILLAVILHHYLIRRISFARMVAVVLTAVVAIFVIGVTRTGRTVDLSTEVVSVRLIADVSTPTAIMADLLELIPSQYEYRLGSTYAEALRYLPPGPISRSLFGPPLGGGTAVYHRMIGRNAPSVGVTDGRDTGSGLGFSLQGEGYLNFGWPGMVMVAATFGLFTAWAWKRMNLFDPRRAYHLLYPTILAYMPYTYRSDALQLLKSVLWPMIIIAAVLWLARSGARTAATQQPTQNSRL